MTHVYISEIAQISEEKISKISNFFGDALKSKFEAVKNEKVLELSVNAYSLLSYALSKNGIENCTLSFTEKGKPYIDKCPINFSVSHTDDLVGVVITDEKVSIGLDIEKITPKKTEAAGRFTERYMPDVRFAGKGEIFDKNKISLLKNFEKSSSNLIFCSAASKELTKIEKWSIAEAVLKCDGGGFSSIGNKITHLIKQMSTQSEILSLCGKEYVLALAKSVE